jgi:hypothetical protein
MDRYEYLNMKYSFDNRMINVLRIGVVAAAAIVSVGVVHNLGILLWTLVRLFGSG